jgi:putative transposase
MVRYRRNFVAGGTFFFTATLEDRRSAALPGHIDSLRSAFRSTRQSHPFTIDAIVVLPDHLHAVMTLPKGDANYSARWSLIKRRFTTALIARGVSVARHRNGEYALWQRRFWEHTIRDDNGTSITFISIRSNTDWSSECETGRIHHFTAMSGRGCCRRTGRAT